MKRSIAILLLLICAAALGSLGQTSKPRKSDQSVTGLGITFDRMWDAVTPQKITITISPDGVTKYHSSNPGKTGDDIDEYKTEFTISPRCRDKLFGYAKEANYFDGDFVFKKHVVASTGEKKLTYADAARHFNTTYDYSDNRAIQEITSTFLGISSTIEHGRKLLFLRRFDKLGLEAELKGMEEDASNHNMAQLQLIAPTLESIVQDSSILNIARERAQRLLAKAHSE